jgi:UDP-3-O-[3-hydroxymyristoyl] N-acetylglucosamine deacetylase
MNTDDGGARQRVLLIDDDESVAGSLYQYLLAQGCDVEVAVDSASAEVLMEARQYDVVVVDPYLTGGVVADDGALLALIRGCQPQASLFVLTGYGSSSLTISAERQGASAVLTKPQSVMSLGQLIVDARHPVGETRP